MIPAQRTEWENYGPKMHYCYSGVGMDGHSQIRSRPILTKCYLQHLQSSLRKSSAYCTKAIKNSITYLMEFPLERKGI